MEQKNSYILIPHLRIFFILEVSKWAANILSCHAVNNNTLLIAIQCYINQECPSINMFLPVFVTCSGDTSTYSNWSIISLRWILSGPQITVHTKQTTHKSKDIFDFTIRVKKYTQILSKHIFQMCSSQFCTSYWPGCSFSTDKNLLLQTSSHYRHTILHKNQKLHILFFCKIIFFSFLRKATKVLFPLNVKQVVYFGTYKQKLTSLTTWGVESEYQIVSKSVKQFWSWSMWTDTVLFILYISVQ